MIIEKTRTVYFSPAKGRHYMTKKSAIKAEAIAIILRKHPSEKPEYENGLCIYGGFHWTSLPRSNVLFRRVYRLVKLSSNIK